MLTQKVERNYHLSRLYSSHYCFLVDKTLYCFCSHKKIQLALLDHEEQYELCTVQCHSQMELKGKNNRQMRECDALFLYTFCLFSHLYVYALVQAKLGKRSVASCFSVLFLGDCHW